MEIKEVRLADVLAIRHVVLRPGEARDAVRIPGDNMALHIGAFDGELIGVASLFISGDVARLRKFAVLPDHQGRGIGSAMLTHMQAQLRARGVVQIWCDARVAAAPLYARHGMVVTGEAFQKGGRAYLRMQGAL